MQIQISDQSFQSNNVFVHNYDIDRQTADSNKSAEKTHKAIVGGTKSPSVVHASRPQPRNSWLSHLVKAFSGLQQWVIGHVTSVLKEVEDPLYMQAQRDRSFRQYADWHQSITHSFKSFANGLKLGISPGDFHRCVLSHWESVQKDGFLSPMVYAAEVERLARVVSKMKLSRNYKDVLDELRGRLHLTLQKERDIAKLIISDITYTLILLSGGQISGQRFLNSLRVYRDVLDVEILTHFRNI